MIRRVCLGLLLSLSLILLLPSPLKVRAEAPNCDGKSPGHYYSSDPILSADTSGCGPCVTGHRVCEWDCVENETTHEIHVQNFTCTVNMCNIHQCNDPNRGYYYMSACCNYYCPCDY